MKGFGIEIKNDLLDPKHIEHMGVAVWLYMWFIDKMTSISEEGTGLVLGGKPIKYKEVAEEMGLTERTYSRWVSILSKEGYINAKRTPYGIVFSVNKAFKRFGKRTAINGVSQEKESRQERRISEPKVADLLAKSGGSNKTVAVDIPEDKGNREETPGEFAKRFFGGDQEAYSSLAVQLEAAGIPAPAVQREMQKFIAYWTEPTRSGKLQLWETKPTFEVKRRLGTWFRNAAERGARATQRAGTGVTV